MLLVHVQLLTRGEVFFYGRKLIHLGARWGVGNGSTIKIAKDNWIPGSRPEMLRTLMPLTDGQTVDSLFAGNSLSWNDASVHSVFEETVAEQVLKIPISQHGGGDFVSWPHSRFGVYTARSAYHLTKLESFLVARSTKGRGMVSDSASDERLWKSLWKITCPGKMHITLWRFAHNCLPSGEQLQRRHIPASYAWIHCSVHESVEHPFLFCPFAVRSGLL
jgi:hypothetical protein